MGRQKAPDTFIKEKQTSFIESWEPLTLLILVFKTLLQISNSRLPVLGPLLLAYIRDIRSGDPQLLGSYTSLAQQDLGKLVSGAGVLCRMGARGRRNGL